VQSRLDNKAYSYPVGSDPLRKKLRKILVDGPYPTKDMVSMNNMIDAITAAFLKDGWRKIIHVDLSKKKMREVDNIIENYRKCGRL
jgi:hypothetical protein